MGESRRVAEEHLAPRRLGQNKRLGTSRLGDSVLILDFTELLDTTAAGPVHVLSALKVATNETYCLGSYTIQVIYMYPSKAYLSQSGPARWACHDRQGRVRPTMVLTLYMSCCKA